MSDDPEKIRITLDDLDSVAIDQTLPQTVAPTPAPDGAPREWGSIAGAATGGTGGQSLSGGGSFFLKAWVYLALAGIGGAFFAWAICEPAFEDGGKHRWGNALIFPMLITFMSVGFAAAESIVERSVQKAALRGLLALILGVVFGFVFYFVANVIYMIGLRALIQTADHITPSNPSLWIVRAIAWMAFGVSGGIVYGIAGQSGKKCLYGVLGGIAGAGLGGFVYDPISLLTGGAAASRCVGMMIFGASTGLAIGLVESALKDRWLYVSGGPLAGKQFILYKSVTRLGRDQASEIYLFKDLAILPQHAAIEMRGVQALLRAIGPTYVGGQQVGERILRSGDLIQIGRYSFQYQEKSRAHT